MMFELFFRFRISIKLIMASVVILCCTEGVSVFVLQGLDKASRADAKIHDNAVPAIKILDVSPHRTLQFRQVVDTGMNPGLNGAALPLGVR